MCVINGAKIIGVPFHIEVRNFISFYRKHPEIKAVKIFGYFFFYTLYANDITFFLLKDS